MTRATGKLASARFTCSDIESVAKVGPRAAFFVEFRAFRHGRSPTLDEMVGTIDMNVRT